MATSARRAASTSSAKPSSAIQPDSPQRLVQAAREVLAEQGLAGFKVLDVAARANANVALINYHFGGRDGLLDEVVRRTATEVAQARATRLSQLLEISAGAMPDPRAVVHCWIDPWIENVRRKDNREVMMLMLHLMFAADVDHERKERLLEGNLEITARFVDVLAQCYPEVSRSKMAWRMLCAVGSSYLVLGQLEPVGWRTLSGGAGRPHSHDAGHELVQFILGGFSAPEAQSNEAELAKRKSSGKTTASRRRAVGPSQAVLNRRS
jgi:AcrR family transcriptional regulator